MALLARATAGVAVEEVAVGGGGGGSVGVHLKLINFRSEQETLSSGLKCHLPNIIS